jgi:ribonuclease P protein component
MIDGYLKSLGFAGTKPPRGARGFETHLPTKPAASSQDTWLSRAYADSGRPSDTEAPAPEGPPSPDSMSVAEASHSFPKILRLLRRSEFRRVYEEGRRRRALLCTVFYRANGLPHSRLGITVPRAVGKSVLRNRVKRRVREALRVNLPTLPGGWDIVLNPRQGAAAVPFPRLQEEILRLLPQAPP